MIPHLFHIVQGGVYHKQSRPHVNPYIYDDIKTIRDHTHLSAHGGARFYLADVFPKQYHGRLFMCNIHEHSVLTDIMQPNGSSFIGRHGDDFLPTNDLAWVGFSLEIGPEGGVYVLDWHDTDICGNAINFPNSGRVYRIMPKGAAPIQRPNLRSLSDEELVDLQWHSNDWYVRQARVLLHSRAAAGELNTAAVHQQLAEMFASATTTGKRLRAMWALHVTGGLAEPQLHELLEHEDQYIRAWAIQLLCDDSSVDAFYLAAAEDGQSSVSGSTLSLFSMMAKKDPSPIVRLYLASAAQRLPYSLRWPILGELAKHHKDIDDHNLPRMYWFGLEPMVPKHPQQALRLAVSGKIPMLQEFVARRMVSGDVVAGSRPEWQRDIERAAPGFTVANVGEGGVVFHKVFRNDTAVQTHPLDRKIPCRLSRTVKVPTGKATFLVMRVSHHPHGDWQLRVLVNGKLITEKIIGPNTVSKDEWLDIHVDLSEFADKKIELAIENKANDWMCEWAYWNHVVVLSK